MAHNVDEEDIFGAQKNLLKWYLLWPFESKIIHIKYVLLITFTSIIPLGTSLNLIHSYRTGENLNFEVKIEDYSKTISVLGLMYIMSFVYAKRYEIIDIMKTLQDFNRYGIPSNYDVTIKKCRIFTYVYNFVQMIGIILHTSVITFNTDKCESMNLQYNMTIECGFISYVWYPFEFQRYRYIINIASAYSAMIVVTYGSSSFSLFYICVECILIRIDHLKVFLEDALRRDVDKDCKFYLKRCIEYHIHIIDLSNKVNACFGPIVFFGIFLSSVILSLVGYQLTEEIAIGFAIHFFGWFSTIFINTFLGQMLLNKSDDLVNAIFHNEWYAKDVDVQRDIKFMLMRCNKPISLKVMGIDVVNLEMCATIMNTTYQYMALLKNIR